MKITFYSTAISVCFLLSGIPKELSAQYPNIAPPAASSMNLINSIRTSVNYPTGKANIEIPFFTLKTPGVQVPVSISYNTSGIRIEDRAAEVGLGWRLAAGGKVTRIVKQRPDVFTNNGTLQPWGETSLNVALSFFTNLSGRYANYNQIDSEPDLFFFEIPGNSGMFVFDEEGKAHTIPYQPVSIELSNNDSFIIRDNQGNTYYFGTSVHSRERATTLFKNANIIDYAVDVLDYTSTWHLEKIITYTGENIDFFYSDGLLEQTVSTNYTFTYLADDEELYARPNVPHTDWILINDSSRVSTTTNTRFLYKIESGQESIQFTKYSGNSLYGNTIGAISYYSGETLVKTAALSYELFAHNRIFLKEITDRTPSNLEMKRCSFDYNKNRLLPTYTSMDYDSWGYYNYDGVKTNTTHMPDDNHLGMSIWQSIPKPLFANRNPNLESTKACILERIRYNTGGCTEYIYGSNVYTGGLRIEGIRHFEGNSNVSLLTRYEYIPDYSSTLIPQTFSIKRHAKY